MTSALPALVSILLDLVAVGSEFLPDMAGGFADAAQRAAEFVHEARETGQLHEWIASGLDTLRQLGELLGNIGGIASAVFRGLDLGGAGLLDRLVALTGQVRTFLESVQGQQALAAFGQLLSTVSDVVGEVLLVALQQLAPIVVALAPGFAQLAVQVGSVLVAALTVVGPLLVQLATFLSQNMAWLGPLAIGLYGAAKAFDAVTVAMRVLTAASAVNPWVVIITATIALATLIITHRTRSPKPWERPSGGCRTERPRSGAGSTAPSFTTSRTPPAEWATGCGRSVLDFFGWLGSLPGKAAPWFGGVARAAGDKHCEVVRFFRYLPGNILRALGDLGSLLVQAGRDIVLGLLRGLRDFAHKTWDWVAGIAQSVWDGITHFFSIFSPSKRMRWAGRMIGLGLATGLDASTGVLASAAAQVAHAGLVTVPVPRLLPPSDPPTPGTASGHPGGSGSAMVQVTNYYPQAEPTSLTVNRSLQYASALGWG